MRRFAMLLPLLLAIGCLDSQLPARPQAVLYVNTDVLVPRLADTLRVDVLGESGDPRTFVRPNASDWPVSFGVPSPSGGGTIRLRLRVYEASHIAGRNPSELSEDLGDEDPLPPLTIDRIIELSGPGTGIRHLGVLMAGDCLGRPPDPSTGISCIAADDGTIDFAGSPADGLTLLDEPLEPGADSLVGTWEALVEKDCVGEPRAESGIKDAEVCIPGGAFFLGDGRLGVNAHVGAAWASIPERLVRLSPFFIDRFEVTVARFREHASAVPREEWLSVLESRLCTYTFDGTNGDAPMNCVSLAGAHAFCEADGGRLLPSDAQWEYAASGRGAEHMWPWGNELVDCHRAAYARVGPSYPGGPLGTRIGELGECWWVLENDEAWTRSTDGPARVGAYDADRSIDGVFDLGGNLEEWVRDSHLALTHECWDQPLLVDPVCFESGALPRVRGGTWAGPAGGTSTAIRRESVDGIDPGPSRGFRCARPATGPEG